MIGEGERGHTGVSGRLEKIVDAGEAVEEGVGRVAVEMHEGIWHATETPE
jgi:hypothetical protein